jgi:hypothetical protein
VEKEPEKDIVFIGLNIRKELLELIEKDRSLSRLPRAAWVTQAIIEKLERAGYELKK